MRFLHYVAIFYNLPWFCLIKVSYKKLQRNPDAESALINVHLKQWFPNFSGAQTTWNNLVVLEAQNNDLYRDSRTTLAYLADRGADFGNH